MNIFTFLSFASGKKLYALFLSALNQSFDLKARDNAVLKSFFTIFLMISSLSFGQTSFLGIDGGLEGTATIDNTGITGPTAGKWTKNNTSQTIANETTNVRSGGNSLRVNNSTTTGRRLWSPNFTVSSTTSQVTVQYYKRVSNVTNSQEDQPGIINNTEGISGNYNAFSSVANSWVKVTYSKASSTFTNISGLLLHRQIGTGGDMFIDDMCVYTGTVDTTAPNAPTTPFFSGQTTSAIEVSWTAASTGVDGGGYLVVRGTVDPITAPNVNGIYASGNTIAAGMTVVYQGTSTSFTDSSLSAGTNYYYRIYTYDKAYNYSPASTGNSATTSAGFKVTYAGNANTTGSAPTDPTNYASGSLVNVLGNTGTLLKTNYNFTGWNTLADGTGTSYTAPQTGSFNIVANTSLYAKWTGNVTYDPNGGSGTTNDTTNYLANQSVSTQPNGYSYTGFTFAGWNTQADGLGTNYEAGQANAFNFSGNIMLYAKWASTSSVTYANFQFPTSKAINEGETYTVYGRVYADGITNKVGQGAGISAWVGYSVSSPDPNTGIWIWVPLSYFGDDGSNNDEYSGSLGSGIIPGTYHVVTRFQIGSGIYVYGGKNNAIWASAADSGSLTVNSNKVTWANIQSPVSGTIVVGDAYNVYSQVYKAGITGDANSHAGITAWIGYNSTNANPAAGGWTWVAATRNNVYSDTSNDEYVADIGTGRAAGTYYYASRYQMSGSTEYFYGGHAGGPNTGGEWGNPVANINGVLTVRTPPEINIKQGATNILTTGTYGFGNQVSGTSGSAVTFTIENTGQANLTVGALTISGVNQSEFAITQGASATVNGGDYTTFTVTFSPTSTGAKTAQLSLVNNDTDENPYVINLTGTGTASAASDITIKSGYTYPQNISYADYQATDITGGTNDIEIAQFTIRDGGASADADNFGTTLTQLSFNLTNGANVRRIAIYDGANEVAEQAGSTTHVFSGLNLTAPDGGIKDFSIRVSFKNVVTDNQQIVIGITATTTAAASGSTFATTSAGAAVTSNAGDNNRIEVTADRMAFVQQPTNTNINAAMTSGVTVKVQDVNSNIDLDITGNITLTSTGTLTGAPVSTAVTLTTGIATFTGLTHTVAGTGFTLTAAKPAFVSVVSNPFNIALVSSATDYFQSKATGNWGTAATWESSSDGITWLNSTLAPTSAAAAIIINNGDTVTVASSANAKNLTVKSGGKLQLNAGITLAGNFNIEDTGSVTVNYAPSNPTTTIWAGTEIFAGDSKFIVNKWDRSVELFANESEITTNPVTNAKFGYLDINLGTSGITDNWTYVLPSSGSYNLTYKDFSITNSTVVNMSLNAGDVTIGGDFIIDGSGNVQGQTQAGSKIYNVKGNFVKNGSGNFRLTNSGSGYIAKLNIDKNLTVNAGYFIIDNGITGVSTAIVNLGGNLVKVSGSYMTNVNTNSTTNAFNFVGNSTNSPQTVDLNVLASDDMLRYKFYVKNGAYVKVVSQDWKLATDAKLTVEDGGTLDFGFNNSVPYNVVTNGAQRGMTFTAASGSILKITSAYGLTTDAASSTAGNVQTPVGGRFFDPGATYHYIGKSATVQKTGNAIAPAAKPLKGKIIVEMENADGQFAASFSRTIDSPGTLEIKTGVVTDDTANGFIGTGNVTMNSAAGRYITRKTGPQPALSGIYNLTNGVVEFANSQTAEATIRVTPQYYNVDVSGSKVETGGKDFIVNNLLKITTPTAILVIPSVPESTNPYVVTAKKGIQVVSGGQAIFRNNAQLMQDSDAVNSGDISMEREAKIPVSTFNQYAYWSSPVIGQNFKNIFPGNPTSALYHNESNNKFYTSTGAYIAGRGLAVRNPFIATGSPTVQTASMKGTPYNSDLTYNLTFTDALHGYNLVGNPYPSNLDLNELYGHSTNIASTFYFWDNTSNVQQTQLGDSYTGDSYAKYNALAGEAGTGIPAPGTGAAASNGAKTPNNILKIGQGFMVRAKSSGSSVGFKNADRITTQTAAQFFGKDGTAAVSDRYLLEFVTPSALVFSNAVIYFANGNSNFAEDDSKFENYVSEGLFTIAGEEKVVINGRSSFGDTDVVKVGSRSFANGTYKIRLVTKEGIFDNGQNIYLKDRQTGIITNLTEGAYAFTANAGETTGRFDIIYQPETVLATNGKAKEELKVYRDGQDFVIKSPGKKISGVEVYDSSGKLILKSSTNRNTVGIDGRSWINGVYVLKIDRNGEITTKKVVK